MNKDKLVKRQTWELGKADLWMLPKTHGLKPWSYEHELVCAELFSTFIGRMTAWSYEPDLGFYPDRGMQIFDKTFYLEVDRATETYSKLSDKIDRYRNYGIQTGERFYVIFVLAGKGIDAAKTKLLSILKQKGLLAQFLVVSHADLMANPYGKCLQSPKGIFGLEELY